ncbi:MAG: hypothetical protein F4Y02_04295 [Chloroflexi bacterium]|nr:hypothetical protein [Chloroflexota bacterium]
MTMLNVPHAAIVLLIAIFSASIRTGHAEPTPATEWLIQEPATLLDLGVARVRTQAERIAHSLDSHYEQEGIMFSASGRDPVPASAFASVGYKLSSNELLIELSIIRDDLSLTAAACNRRRNWFLDELGINGAFLTDADRQRYGINPTTEALDLLARWFSHEGFRFHRRPDNLEVNLLNQVVTVSVWAGGDAGRFWCRGRLNEYEVPVQIETKR